MAAIAQRLRLLLTFPVVLYDKAQVELQGQYSLARLQEFAQYTSEISLGWAFAVVLLTPLPCLATIIVLDLMPMHSAYSGVYNQTMWLWFRAVFSLSLISICVIMQLHQSAPTLPMSRTRLLTISTSLGVYSAVLFFALGVTVGFPTPFVTQIVAVPWVWALGASLWVSWRPTLQVDAEARSSLQQYLIAYASELVIILVYPVYQYGFSLLNGTGQTAFAVLLPIMKLFFKNWVSFGMMHMEDLAPTTIVFNVDVFHALFLSTTAQKSKSVGSTLAIIAVDAAQMMVAFYEIQKRLLRFDDLRRRRHAAADTQASSQKSLDRALVKLDLVSYACHIISAHPRVRENPALALSRHLRKKHQRLDSSGSHTNTRLPRTSESISRYTNTRVVPIASGPEMRAVLPPADGYTAAAMTKRDRILVKSVACVLQILHMTEFYVLIEFAEVMMSCMFALYLSVITRLPNRVHYVNLRELTEEELRATTNNVAILALLELLSFLVLCFGLNRQLKRFSSMRQLAFALQKHWRMAQAMLVLWSVLVMQLSLTHTGSDYSFKFAWLHANSTASNPS